MKSGCILKQCMLGCESRCQCKKEGRAFEVEAGVLAPRTCTDLTFQTASPHSLRHYLAYNINVLGIDMSSSKSLVFSNWPGKPLDTSIQGIRAETYHIAFILHHLLPSELVAIIIHHAGLHEASIISKQLELAVSRERSPFTYLKTPPIYCKTRTTSPVVSVAFRITAQDHGLDLGIGKSYFTAGVVRKGFEKREIFCNTPASDMYETKEIVWRRDGEGEEEREWVRNLSNGDEIVIKAWAQWATFENRVKSVEVELRFMTVVA